MKNKKTILIKLLSSLLLFFCCTFVSADHDDKPLESYHEICLYYGPTTNSACGKHHEFLEARLIAHEEMQPLVIAFLNDAFAGTWVFTSLGAGPYPRHNYERTNPDGTGLITGFYNNNTLSQQFHLCDSPEILNPFTQLCQPSCPVGGTHKYRQSVGAAEAGQGLYCGSDNCEIQKALTISVGGVFPNYLDTSYTGYFCGDTTEIPPTSTTTTTNNPDGSTTDTTVDDTGTTTTTTQPDGTTTTTTPDGTTTTTSPDGTTTTENPDGTTTTEDPDGTTTTEEPDGTITTTSPDGTTTTTDPNGNITTGTSGGGTTTTDPNGNTIEITDSDGNQICDLDPLTAAPDCSNDVCVDDPNTTQNECSGQSGDGSNGGDNGGGSCVDDPDTDINECGAGECDPTAIGYFDCIIGEIEEQTDTPYEFVDYADQIDLAKQALSTELQNIRTNLSAQYQTTVNGAGGLDDNVIDVMGVPVNISLTNVNPQALEMLRNIFYFVMVLSSTLILLGGLVKS